MDTPGLREGRAASAWRANVPRLVIQYTGLFSCNSGLVYCGDGQVYWSAGLGMFGTGLGFKVNVL